jgi:flagellin-like hook-associated protein FlgL
MGDLNEDGDLDVLAVYSNSLRVFLSDGSGGFNGSTSYGVGTTASSLALMDINGDDKLDVAVANSGSDNTTLYLGSGDGVLSSRSTLSISASFSSHQIVAGDFNGDGHSDLISYGPWFDGMSLARLGAVFLNNGTGSFSQSMTINLLLLGGAERAEVRDYNKDGYDDLAYGGNIYSSAAGQSFTPAITNPFWSYEGFYEDFDGDGIVDVRYFDDDNFLWNTYFGNSKSVNRLGYLQMNSAEDAARFLPILDDSIQKVQDLIAELGVVEERLRLSYDSGTKLQTSLLEASENLVSVDYASVTADLTRQQIMQQAQIAAQVQASLSQRSVLALLDQL